MARDGNTSTSINIPFSLWSIFPICDIEHSISQAELGQAQIITQKGC